MNVTLYGKWDFAGVIKDFDLGDYLDNQSGPEYPYKKEVEGDFTNRRR